MAPSGQMLRTNQGTSALLLRYTGKSYGLLLLVHIYIRTNLSIFGWFSASCTIGAPIRFGVLTGAPSRCRAAHSWGAGTLPSQPTDATAGSTALVRLLRRRRRQWRMTHRGAQTVEQYRRVLVHGPTEKDRDQKPKTPLPFSIWAVTARIQSHGQNGRWAIKNFEVSKPKGHFRQYKDSQRRWICWVSPTTSAAAVASFNHMSRVCKLSGHGFFFLFSTTSFVQRETFPNSCHETFRLNTKNLLFDFMWFQNITSIHPAK